MAETGIGYEYDTSPIPEIRAGKVDKPETLTAAGVVGLDTEATTISLTQGSNQALTLADGAPFQKKVIHLAVKSGAGNAVLTPANLNGGDTLTFDAVGEYAELRFMGTEWFMVNGTATLA